MFLHKIFSLKYIIKKNTLTFFFYKLHNQCSSCQGIFVEDVLCWDSLKSKNQPILQLAQYSIQTKSEEYMVLEYKIDGCINYGFPKISLYFISKDTTIKKFAHGILIYLNSPIIQHLIVLHQISHIFPFFIYWIEQFWQGWKL